MREDGNAELVNIITMINPRNYDRNLKKLGAHFDTEYNAALKKAVLLLKTIPMIRCKADQEIAQHGRERKELEDAVTRLNMVRIMVDDAIDTLKAEEETLTSEQRAYLLALETVDMLLYGTKRTESRINSKARIK